MPRDWNQVSHIPNQCTPYCSTSPVHEGDFWSLLLKSLSSSQDRRITFGLFRVCGQISSGQQAMDLPATDFPGLRWHQQTDGQTGPIPRKWPHHCAFQATQDGSSCDIQPSPWFTPNSTTCGLQILSRNSWKSLTLATSFLIPFLLQVIELKMWF